MKAGHCTGVRPGIAADFGAGGGVRAATPATAASTSRDDVIVAMATGNAYVNITPPTIAAIRGQIEIA